MKFLSTPAEARVWCQDQRKRNRTIGYVPTMGALHDGHLALVKRAARDNDVVCVSIFVNPLQFNSSEDLEKYPRDMEQDLALLRQAGVSMVYTGTLQNFFPDIPDPSQIKVTNPCRAIAGLEAELRPGHLEGVQAIVERLFQTVGPCRGYFGEKDFQQTLLIREIAARQGDIEIIVCPTVREQSGLAMSSRNQRLSTSARSTATRLYQALNAANDAWSNGQRDPRALQSLLMDALQDPAITIDYATVRDPDNWTPGLPETLDNKAQALVAVTIDGVRLIDNLRLAQD